MSQPNPETPGDQSTPDPEKELSALEQLLTKLPKPSSCPNPDEIETNEEIAAKVVELVNQTQKKKDAEKRTQPQAMETKTPVPAETGKVERVEEARVQAASGFTIPTYGTRPQAPQKVKEEGSVIVAKALAEQLGTAPEIKAQMRIDERKLAVLDDVTLAALMHFSYRGVYDEVRYWGHIVEWWLTGSQGIGGLGRRHILQGLANSSGVQSVDKAKQPNVLARNVWDRNWREKAEAEGKVVDDQ